MLGARTINATFAPSNGDFVASTSSGAGNAQTLVFAQSDLAVTKSNAVQTFNNGELIVYSVSVRNLGPDAAANIRVIDNVPSGLSNVVWSCDASGGVSCPQSGGSGNLDVVIGSFPVGGLLSYTFYGNVIGAPSQISNTAFVELPADTTIEDTNLGNNSATDTDRTETLFRDGFESPAIAAPSGNYLLPALALRSALDEVARSVLELDDSRGVALRVYGRVFDGRLQFALAQRDASGFMRLGAWTAPLVEPSLKWTARAVGDGWVVDSARLD